VSSSSMVHIYPIHRFYVISSPSASLSSNRQSCRIPSYIPPIIVSTTTERGSDLPPQNGASASAQVSGRGGVALVLPLLGGGVAAGEIEPCVGLVVVNGGDGVGDGRAIEVAAGCAQVVQVEVVRGAAVGGAPVCLWSHTC
jgi:hypothetical protein